MGFLLARRAGAVFTVAVLMAACGYQSARAPSPGPSPVPGCSPTPTPSGAPSPSAPPSTEPITSPVPSSVPIPPPERSIQISLSAQHLWAYDGQTLVVSTDVTTGMPELPTPTGRFQITAKYSPYRFISPWAKGSPYYYEPLDVGYAMLFADGGYFIHDAWWQRNFGPGGNLKTGSHGCVNVPPAAMPALYQWAQVGDPVDIAQ